MMKVATQGGEVINLLWAVIAARGFEKDTYFEPGSTPAQMDYCLKVIRKPVVDEARYRRVWSQVHALKDEYEMNP